MPAIDEEVTRRLSLGSSTSTSGRTALSAEWYSLQLRSSQHLARCRSKHSSALAELQPAKKSCLKAKEAVKSTEAAFKQILENEAIKAEVWLAHSQHESIGPASLAAITLYFDGKDIDAWAVKLGNQDNSASSSLGQHELHAPFLQALKAYQAAEEQSRLAAERQCKAEEMEVTRRQAVGLAESLSKAAFLLNICRPFDAVCWKNSLQAIQLALPKSKLVNPVGLDNVLRLVSHLCDVKLERSHDHYSALWHWQAQDGSSQGPFCLMQMVYWLEKGYLKGTDFVYTDNPRFSVSLNQVLAGAKPLENLEEASEPSLSANKSQPAEGTCRRPENLTPHAAWKAQDMDDLIPQEVDEGQNAVAQEVRDDAIGERQLAVEPPEDKDPLRCDSVEEAISSQALQAPLSETKPEAAILAGKPCQQEKACDSLVDTAIQENESFAPEPVKEPRDIFPETAESTELCALPAVQSVADDEGTDDEEERRTEAVELFSDDWRDPAPEHADVAQQLQEATLALQEGSDSLEATLKFAEVSETEQKHLETLQEGEEHKQPAFTEHSSLPQTDLPEAALHEVQDSADSEQERRAQEKAQAKLETQQRRLALKEMRRESQAQARKQRAFEKAEKVRLLEERKALVKAKALQKETMQAACKRKQKLAEIDEGSSDDSEGPPKRRKCKAGQNARTALLPGDNDRIQRLETNVDQLKAEVQSMQRAMQQSGQQSGTRQSVRLASIQSHQEAVHAANEIIHREGSSQRQSEMGAATPERELDSGVGSKRKRLDDARPKKNRRSKSRQRAEEAAEEAADDCCARAIPFAALATQKAGALPTSSRPQAEGSKAHERFARGGQREMARRAGGLDHAAFSQLKSRSKDLRFGRSPVHAWGLFARDAIPREDFVMEYVGETIRSSLEDCKEAEYQRSGLGSSYLFRVDKDTVVDATKKGGLARYINHSCDPNCYTRIVTVEGRKHIAIFSKRLIAPGEELCYDYKFEFEEDNEAVPCHCGAKTCCGRLN